MKTSLANAVKRKTHKERSQPAARLKYGLLEKRKDYVLRAKDFHRKEMTIKALRRKAEERNPDEFYFAMEKKKTKDGVHDGSLSKQNKYSQEELALMKSQDVKYLSMKEKTEKQKIERLKGSLHFIGAAPKAPNQHTVFVDSQDEVKGFDPAQYFNTPKELLGRTYNRPKQEQLDDPSTVVLPKHVSRPTAAAKKAEKRRVAAYTELSQRLNRQQTLARTASHLAYQREVAGKGRKRKLTKKELAAAAAAAGAGEEGLHKTQQGKVFKWKRERRK